MSGPVGLNGLPGRWPEPGRLMERPGRLGQQSLLCRHGGWPRQATNRPSRPGRLGRPGCLAGPTSSASKPFGRPGRFCRPGRLAGQTSLGQLACRALSVQAGLAKPAGPAGLAGQAGLAGPEAGLAMPFAWPAWPAGPAWPARLPGRPKQPTRLGRPKQVRTPERTSTNSQATVSPQPFLLADSQHADSQQTGRQRKWPAFRIQRRPTVPCKTEAVVPLAAVSNQTSVN